MPFMPDRNAAAVRRILESGDWSLLHRRQVRGVLREAFVTSDGYVIKRYTHLGRPPLIRRPWSLEHRALRRLQGDGAPLPVGYVVDRVDGSLRATLVRHYLAGEPVTSLEPSTVEEIAGLLARFHDAGVTTDDAHLQNFLHADHGALAFLDFGRARIFHRYNPLLLAGVAVDLHRFYRAALKRDDRLWSRFLESYFRQSPFRPAGKRLIRWLLAVDMRRYGWVKGSPQ